MCADKNSTGITDDELKRWESIATYFLEGILTPIVSIAGILGKIRYQNGLIVRIISKRSMLR